MNDKTPGIFRGWYVVGSSFAVLFAGFGTAYSFGTFFEPLSETFGATRASVSAVFSWTTAAIFITGALSGAIADRHGPRPIVVFGVLAIAAGFALASQAQSLRSVQLAFALGVGVGVGCAYVPAVGAVQRWFVVRRGIASGIAVTGIGLGTMLLPLLAGILLELMSWRSVFVVFSLGVLLVGLVASVWMSADPQAHGLAADGLPISEAAGKTSMHGQQITLPAIVKSKAFVLLYVSQGILSLALFIPFVHIVQSALDAGVDRDAAVFALGMVGLGSTVGRFVLGALADRWGRRRTLMSVFVLMGMAFGLWWQARSGFAFALFGLIFGTCYGGYVAMIPAFLAEYFSGPRLSTTIGLQYTAAGFGSLLGPVLAGRIYDSGGSYAPAFLMAALACMAAAGLLRFLPLPDSRG